MISVLLPSRGRSSALGAAVRSLAVLAHRPDEVEFLIAADPDDAETINFKAPVQNLRLLITEQRYGYGGLHHYYNALARIAVGEWLMLWNDDALMCTQGWDSVVRRFDGEHVLLWSQANHCDGANMFPIWPRCWYWVLGHVSLSPHNDTWLQWMADELGLQRQVPISVLHQRADVTGDNEDATYAEGRGAISPDGFWPGGEPDRALISADAAKLREYISGHPRTF